MGLRNRGRVFASVLRTTIVTRVYTHAHSCLTVCAEISRKKRALTKTKVTEMTNKAGKEFKTKCESVSGMWDVG